MVSPPEQPFVTIDLIHPLSGISTVWMIVAYKTIRNFILCLCSQHRLLIPVFHCYRERTNEQVSVRGNVCECNLNLACQKFTLTNFSLPRVSFVFAKTAYSLVLSVNSSYGYRRSIQLLNDSFPVQIGSPELWHNLPLLPTYNVVVVVVVVIRVDQQQAKLS